jgi:hypothetical protein
MHSFTVERLCEVGLRRARPTQPDSVALIKQVCHPFGADRAQAVFDPKPSANTTAPHAVITHQIACVAVVKSMPCTRLAATTVPDTATPELRPPACWSMKSQLRHPLATVAFQLLRSS